MTEIRNPFSQNKKAIHFIIQAAAAVSSLSMQYGEKPFQEGTSLAIARSLLDPVYLVHLPCSYMHKHMHYSLSLTVVYLEN